MPQRATTRQLCQSNQKIRIYEIIALNALSLQLTVIQHADELNLCLCSRPSFSIDRFCVIILKESTHTHIYAHAHTKPLSLRIAKPLFYF